MRDLTTSPCVRAAEPFEPPRPVVCGRDDISAHFPFHASATFRPWPAAETARLRRPRFPCVCTHVLRTHGNGSRTATHRLAEVCGRFRMRTCRASLCAGRDRHAGLLDASTPPLRPGCSRHRPRRSGHDVRTARRMTPSGFTEANSNVHHSGDRVVCRSLSRINRTPRWARCATPFQVRLRHTHQSRVKIRLFSIPASASCKSGQRLHKRCET